MPTFYIDTIADDQDYEVRFLSRDFRGYVLRGIMEIISTYDEESVMKICFTARLHRDYDIKFQPYFEECLEPWEEWDIENFLDNRQYYEQLTEIIEKVYEFSYQEKLEEKKRREHAL